MSDRTTQIRPPVVAGRFYEAAAERCRAEANQLVRSELPELPTTLPATLHGGLVPHAGWVCSGRVAGQTLRVLHERSQAKTIFLTGSVHTMALDRPALDTAQAWETPLGRVEVDQTLRDAIAGLKDFDVIDQAHRYEHSLEVELPLIQAIFGEDVRIVPCMIPPTSRAAEWGHALGQLLRNWSEPVLVVVSSDLTHYGPNYRFMPEGGGEAGYQWAHQVNDRRLLGMIERMEEGEIVKETGLHHSACGGGAIATGLAACREMGAQRGYVLEQTDSVRELAALGYRDRENSVGYAGVVFG